MELASDSKKIILGELDIGARQYVWYNYSGNTYYVDFDAVYDRIDPLFLAGIDPQAILNVGSVASDAAQLLLAASVAAVEAEENTFFWDAAARRVYIHLVGGDRPSLHRLVIGVVYGVSNHGGVYGSTLYEGRLMSAPSIVRSRDPLFWGRIAFEGGTITINNADGKFDTMAEDLDVFGNAARIYLGFDEETRAEFRQMFTGTIGMVKISPDTLEVEIKDSRSSLEMRVPDKVFTVADYPDLKPGNEGKSIPIGYGELRNVPAICTNEEEAPAPADYDFLLFDVSRHPSGITSIDIVYVDGVPKVPSASSALNATFSLAAADYAPGQKVTVDCVGYKDDVGNTISKGLDVITDLLARWPGIPYSATAYDQAAWNAALAVSPDVGYFADDPTECYQVIEKVAVSCRGLFIVDRFGKYTFRIPNPLAYPVQTFGAHEPQDLVAIEYKPEEVVGVVRVAYSADWAEDDSMILLDESRRAEVLERYKRAPEPSTFETLLTISADAQAFATAVLDIGAYVQGQFALRLKLGNSLREVGDIIQVPLIRRLGSAAPFLGTVKAEVLGIEYNLLAAEQKLTCRLIEVLPPAGAYVEAGFYDDMFYGDDFYGRSGEAVA